MNGGSSQAIEAWTQYWKSGRGASCFEGSAQEVRLNRLWGEFVDLLEDGGRVLDAATGNGTVARSLAARARARGIGLRIEAVDAAAIDPPRHVGDPQGLLREVNFRGETRLEALPYPDASFDGVVSQFGFEYADETRAAAELVRCLAPGGRLRFVLHARGGAVARDTEMRLERLRGALAENGALALVLALARAAEAGDEATMSAKSAELPAAAEQVRRLALHPPPDDAALFYAREFLELWAGRNRYRMRDVRRSLEDGFANARGVAQRQQEMLGAARSSADMERIAARLAAAGLAVEGAQPLRDERRDAQIAWLLDAQKPSGPR
jgi:SAM-dependent methyltransferase